MNQLAILMAVSTLLVSCTEDEFYYKEIVAPAASQDPKDAGDGTRLKEGDKRSDTDPAGENNGDNNSGNIPEEVTEVFIQNASESNKIDILWVVDNSGSMSDEQASLAANFDAFIQSFASKDIDFQMAITTTDARAGISGEPVAGSIDALNYSAMQDDVDLFKNSFKSMIQVGIRGSGHEQGLQTSYDFFNNYGNSFLREDAFLQVIYVSDENDQSPDMVSAYVEAIQDMKLNAGKVKMHGIVSFADEGQGITNGHARYGDATELTSGSLYDIDGDFYQSLENLGEKIVELVETFPLQFAPVVDSIVVKVNGVESNDWEYIAQGNSIKFLEGAIPVDGDEISVSYEKE